VLTRPDLNGYGQRLQPKASWDDLVLGERETRLLRGIADQVRNRWQVYEDWGFAAKTTRGLGLSALFCGPSGTGKTTAAEVLARDLRLDLYRTDLSAVVSKYIGETEKHLRLLFDAAEAGGWLLFFDEADALFGKRTEVTDAHDRFANIQIDYLLQRIETYQGLAILSTNMRSAMDEAFLRRLRFIVEFPFPDAPQRRAIWALAFPPAVPGADSLDLDRLARLPASGGVIHNIAMNAAFLAAARKSDLDMDLVLLAARDEFAKLQLPVRQRDLAGKAVPA
jgi:SpoVK/Ycf46/Vps4 family AAA+-type ATPase